MHRRRVPDRVGRELDLAERGYRLRGTFKNDFKAVLFNARQK